MSHASGSITAVRWGEICPWLILVRAARVALMLRVIALALVGVLLTHGGWTLVDRVLIDPQFEPSLNRLSGPALTETPGAAVAIDAEAGVMVHAQTFGGPLYRGWSWAMQPFVRLIHADGPRQWVGFTVDGLWAIAVWALIGGAIARIAALYLTQGETIGPIAALRAAFVKWPSTAGAPVVALLGMLIIALPLMAVGLLLRVDLFALAIGLVWALVLLGGVAIAILAIGLALGWPLMWSTVAVERTDAFDGVSRAYAYVFQRPLQALFYVAVAGLLGLLAQLAVNIFVETTLSATAWAVGAGAGDDRMAELLDPYGTTKSEKWAGGGMRFWTTALTGLAAAFPMAYLWPAATGIYLLLRRHIDSTEMTETAFDEGTPVRGLPTLAPDAATGVPQVVNPGGTPTAGGGLTGEAGATPDGLPPT